MIAPASDGGGFFFLGTLDARGRMLYKGSMTTRNYEDAPATQMLATHCGACGRPLVDAVSVESGMGPVCRKKYIAGVDLDDETRGQANALIYRLAVEQTGAAAAATACELRMLGFARLADRVLERVADVRIEAAGVARVAVFTPYDPDAVAAMKTIPGRRWDRETKANTFPVNARGAVWALLRRYFPGATGVGPKGAFSIPAA